MRLTLLLCFALIGGSQAQAQYSSVSSGATLPSACAAGNLFSLTSTSVGLYLCTAPNTWTLMAVSNPFPTNAIMFIDSGSCPTGFTEDSALDGYMMRGTVAAHGDVGGTGGSDTITPTGTNSAPGFTGSAWSAPAIAWPAGVPTFSGSVGTVPAQTFTGSSATTSAVSAGTPAGTNAASATSGNCAATNIAAGTGSTTACKATAPNLTVTAQTFTGSALSTHTHTLTATGTNGTASFTPAGTVAWPAGVPTIGAYTPTGSVAAPAFTGSSFDNRPAFIKLIACKKS